VSFSAPYLFSLGESDLCWHEPNSRLKNRRATRPVFSIPFYFPSDLWGWQLQLHLQLPTISSLSVRSYSAHPECVYNINWLISTHPLSLCVAVCCSVLQCVAVCCSVLQCVAVCRIPCLLSLVSCLRHHLVPLYHAKHSRTQHTIALRKTQHLQNTTLRKTQHYYAEHNIMKSTILCNIRDKCTSLFFLLEVRENEFWTHGVQVIEHLLS